MIVALENFGENDLVFGLQHLKRYLILRKGEKVKIDLEDNAVFMSKLIVKYEDIKLKDKKKYIFVSNVSIQRGTEYYEFRNWEILRESVEYFHL